jgi:hypothetical protein
MPEPTVAELQQVIKKLVACIEHAEWWKSGRGTLKEHYYGEPALWIWREAIREAKAKLPQKPGGN